MAEGLKLITRVVPSLLRHGLRHALCRLRQCLAARLLSERHALCLEVTRQSRLWDAPKEPSTTQQLKEAESSLGRGQRRGRRHARQGRDPLGRHARERGGLLGSSQVRKRGLGRQARGKRNEKNPQPSKQ